MNRRQWVFGAFAATAATAGVALAWRQYSPSGATGDEVGAEVWSLRFDRPDGTELALASLRGQPLLLNFWATWCAPCVKELPLIDGFYREQKARGWQVLGLAIDSPTPVRDFLAKRPVSFPVVFGGLGGTDLSRTLGNPSGALPFTVVVGRDGRIVDRKLGILVPDDLVRWAKNATA